MVASTPYQRQSGAYVGAAAITPGTDVSPGRAVAVICTVAGNVVVKFSDDSTLTVPVATGLTILPFSAKTIVVSGTTATATYAALY